MSTGDENPSGVVEAFYEPAEAARRLQVSASGLRRLATSYEQVHGELPRKGGTQARLFPQEAVERLAQARMLVDRGRFKSTVEALTALEKGLEPEPGAEMIGQGLTAPEAATGEALGLLVAEMQSMKAELERLRFVVEDRNPAQLPPDSPRQAAEHGLLVRVALWLERFLKRS
jgi:hypothetical protein